MVRLIDANALSDSKWWESLTDDFDKARARIIVMSAPTVDAVEVDRCKGCYYYESRNPGHEYCKYFDTLRIDNDYCSSWERKDNG